MSFSKDDTLAVKGIAIILMIQHHNFLSAPRFEGYTVSFFPFSQEFIVLLSNFFKICVGMYVFLSGYGLAISMKKYGNDYTLTGRQYKEYTYLRLIKLMAGYWFIFILSQIVCAITIQRQETVYFNDGIWNGIYKFFIDFLGLANLFGTGTLNGTWWYMGLAIFIIIVVPFIAHINKKYGVFLTVAVCILVPRIILFGTDYNVGSENSIMRWLLAIVLGVAFAQYDVLARMKAFMITKNKILSKLIKFVIATAILIVFYILRVKYSGNTANYTYEFRDNIVPVFVIYYCYEFIIDIPILRNILMFLGKHSMNIFLMHTFIRLYILQDFVYSFKHFALITLVVLVMSLAVSIVIEFMKKHLGYNKLVNKITDKLMCRI